MARLETAEAWCESYIAAFNAADAGQITAHWSFPALIFQAGGRLAFDNGERFTRNTAALLGFYARQGVARAERAIAGRLDMGADGLALSVADRMLDAEGDEIVSWRAAYVLQRLDGSWRASAAFADGELAAWAQRGTPLGGK